MKYTSVSKIENYLLINIDPTYVDQVDSIILGVSKLFDRMTNRKLVAEEEDAVAYFDGNGKPALLVGDLVEVTTLELGDSFGDNLTEVDDDDFMTYPKDEGEPKHTIVLKSGCFPDGIQNIKVTGKIGAYASTPADIELAATVIAAGILNNQLKGNQAKKSETIGSYSVSYSDDRGFADYDRSLATLESYKRFIL